MSFDKVGHSNESRPMLLSFSKDDAVRNLRGLFAKSSSCAGVAIFPDSNLAPEL